LSEARLSGQALWMSMFISSCRRGCVSRTSFASAREDTRRYTRLGCWSLRLRGDEVFPSQEDLAWKIAYETRATRNFSAPRDPTARPAPSKAL